MALFSANVPELMETRDKEIFFKNFVMVALMYPKLFGIKNSTKSHEDRIRYQGLGTFQSKPEGTPVAFSDPIEGTRRRVTHSVFALGYRVTWEAVDDDQWDVLTKMPADLGDSARDHMERFAWDLINDAYAAGTTHTGLEATTMFSATHANLSGSQTTMSNILSPPVALGVTGLEDMMTQWRTTLSEEGRFTDTSAPKLLYHPDNAHQAFVLLQTEFRPGTADNDKSTVASTRSGITPVVDEGVPYISASLSWSLHTPPGKNTIQWNKRKDLFFDRARDADTFDAKHYAAYRASVMWSEWRGNHGSLFS